MTITFPDSGSIISFSQICKSRFNAVNAFANAHDLTIAGVFFYVAIGALNFQTSGADDADQSALQNILYAAIKPKQAAKLLSCDSKLIARWCVTLTKRNLLTREVGGAYRVADANLWFEASRLLSHDPVIERLGAGRAPVATMKPRQDPVRQVA